MNGSKNDRQVNAYVASECMGWLSEWWIDLRSQS